MILSSAQVLQIVAIRERLRALDAEKKLAESNLQLFLARLGLQDGDSVILDNDPKHAVGTVIRDGKPLTRSMPEPRPPVSEDTGKPVPMNRAERRKSSRRV